MEETPHPLVQVGPRDNLQPAGNLDEVEAALDDTNLGRLLDIYEELRENSQLIVITHQKRTMEVADALYGVSMRGDGVTTVVSQRIRDVAATA